MTKRASAFGALASVLLGLSACSSEITCKDACACEGLAGDALCLKTCQANRDAEAKSASDKGCSAQANELSICAADHASCDGVKKQYVYPTDACKTESAALDKCLGNGSSTSTGSN